jgi:hypothetical protein
MHRRKLSRRFAIAAVAAASLAACGPQPEPTRESLGSRAVAFPGAPGSAQPRLAAGSDGRPVLSWLEPAGDAVALRYAVFDGSGFGAPREVTRGDDLFVNWADLPSVQPITADVWVANWGKFATSSAGAYHVATAVSSDGGRTWSAPVQLNDDSTETEHGFVEPFAWDGAIGAFWLDGRQLAEWSFDEPDKLLGTSLRVAKLDFSGQVVAREVVDELVCDCCRLSSALTGTGPVIAYRDRTPEEIRDIVVRRHADAWAVPVAVGADGWQIEGCPVNGPAIAAQGERVAVAWFTAAGGAPRVRFAWSTDGAASFAAPLELDGAGSFGQLGLVLAEDGGAIATWWRSAVGGGTDLTLRTVAANGALGEPRVIAHSSTTQPVDVPQIIAYGDDLLVAWTSLDDDATVHTLLVDL